MPVIRDPLVFQDGTSQATAAASGTPTVITTGVFYLFPVGTQTYVPLDVVVNGEVVIDGELVFG